ncbi:hypothetical protein [Streptomyces buecherae]|uniref:WXG100 family type VII secretion target n=1 Tax=Streptomyces buecherae TaxID=2763006 RepID=A0A7H8N7B2_9ACTN|nr:hypothetical protein [Streptomyces buecherae]QKW50434.1 hypothetical protein HUT08_13850 [Streptomyces buecherae]
MGESEDKVANPRKADLEKLRRDVAREAEGLKKALKTPTEDIGGDTVWVGKNARAWHTELKGRHEKVGTHVEKLLPLIDAAIAAEPDKVSASDARAYNAS